MGALTARYVLVLVACMLVAAWGGQWWGQRELRILVEMPEGTFYMSRATQVVWQKTGNRNLAYLPIPDPDQARLLRMFMTPTTVIGTEPTTTTTSLPKGGHP